MPFDVASSYPNLHPQTKVALQQLIDAVAPLRGRKVDSAYGASTVYSTLAVADAKCDDMSLMAKFDTLKSLAEFGGKGRTNVLVHDSVRSHFYNLYAQVALATLPDVLDKSIDPASMASRRATDRTHPYLSKAMRKKFNTLLELINIRNIEETQNFDDKELISCLNNSSLLNNVSKNSHLHVAILDLFAEPIVRKKRLNTAVRLVGTSTESQLIMTGLLTKPQNNNLAMPLTLKDEKNHIQSDMKAPENRLINLEEKKRSLKWENIISNGSAIRVNRISSMPLMGFRCKGEIVEGKVEKKANEREKANNPYNFHESKQQYQDRMLRVAVKLFAQTTGANGSNIVCGQEAPGLANGQIDPNFVNALALAGFNNEWQFHYQPKSATEGQLTLVHTGTDADPTGLTATQISSHSGNSHSSCQRLHITEADGKSYDLVNIDLDPEAKETETQIAALNLDSRSTVIVGNTGRHVEAVDTQLQAQGNKRYLMFRPQKADQLYDDEVTKSIKMKSTHIVMYNGAMLRNLRDKVSTVFDLRNLERGLSNVPYTAPLDEDHPREVIVEALRDEALSLNTRINSITTGKKARAIQKAFWARFDSDVVKIDAEIEQLQRKKAQLADQIAQLVTCNSNRALVEKIIFMDGPAKEYFDRLSTTKNLSDSEQAAVKELNKIQAQSNLLLASQTDVTGVARGAPAYQSIENIRNKIMGTDRVEMSRAAQTMPLTNEFRYYRDVICDAIETIANIPHFKEDAISFASILRRPDITLMECATLIREAYTNSAKYYSFSTADVLVRMSLGKSFKNEQHYPALLHPNLARAINAFLGNVKAMVDLEVKEDKLSSNMLPLYMQLQRNVKALNPLHGEVIPGAARCAEDLEQVAYLTDAQFQAWLAINMEFRYRDVFHYADVQDTCNAILAAHPQQPVASAAQTKTSYNKLSPLIRDRVLQLIDNVKAVKRTGWWDRVEGATAFYDFLTSNQMKNCISDEDFKQRLDNAVTKTHKNFISRCKNSKEIEIPKIATICHLITEHHQRTTPTGVKNSPRAVSTPVSEPNNLPSPSANSKNDNLTSTPQSPSPSDSAAVRGNNSSPSPTSSSSSSRAVSPTNNSSPSSSGGTTTANTTPNDWKNKSSPATNYHEAQAAGNEQKNQRKDRNERARIRAEEIRSQGLGSASS